MLFISAGHHLKDSGAVGSGTQENLQTIIFRDKVVAILRARGLKVITDDDHETLGEYLAKIKTGDGSVVCEYHFDAANGTAFGSTALVGIDADKNDKSMAKELVDITASIIGTKNRGVISESESHRGRLGLMRETGIVALIELCFIDNSTDFANYTKVVDTLAVNHANILEKYEKLIP
jgi:N-acetylmuramoyl-L-alanine amidase